MITEKEKMLAGELYNAADPQLIDKRRRARDLCKSLNNSRDNEREFRSQIFQNLFGSAGADIWIEPPFFCDYGSNISHRPAFFHDLICCCHTKQKIGQLSSIVPLQRNEDLA